MINKVVGSFDEAVADMKDGAVVLIGGFGGPGECPSYLIAGVARKEVKDLTIVGNTGGWGVDLLNVLRQRMAAIIDRQAGDERVDVVEGVRMRGGVAKGALEVLRANAGSVSSAPARRTASSVASSR